MSINPKQWTQKVQEAFGMALQIARENGHAQIYPLHLALALLEEDNSLGKQAVLRSVGEDGYLSLLRVLKKRLVRLPSVQPPPGEASRANIVQESRRQWYRLCWQHSPCRGQ